MDTTTCTYEHYGVNVRIFWDKDPMSPREWDNLGTLATLDDGYRVYSLDEDIHIEGYVQCACGDVWEPDPNCKLCEGTGELSVNIADELAATHDAIVALPVRMSDSDIWDVTDDDDANAVIYCTREKAQREELDAAKVKEVLLAELRDYDHYLKGEAYGYVVECGGFEDSCWGFVGDVSYCQREAESAAEYIAQQVERERVEAAAMAARGIVTVAA